MTLTKIYHHEYNGEEKKNYVMTQTMLVYSMFKN